MGTATEQGNEFPDAFKTNIHLSLPSEKRTGKLVGIEAALVLQPRELAGERSTFVEND